MSTITPFLSDAPTRHTPWGYADAITALHIPFEQKSLFLASTPSHGGVYVPPSLLARLPQEARDFAKTWSGSECWFEEDCCALVCMLAFPRAFESRLSSDDLDPAGLRRALSRSLSAECLDALENCR